MCGMCPDFVDFCYECPKWNDGPFGRPKFYVDSRYCEHLQAKYGHEIATFEDQKARWLDEEDEEE